MSQHPGHVPLESLRAEIAAHRAGDPDAGDRLCRLLHAPVRRDVRRFLGDDHPDCDDVIQEALLAALRYVEGEREFQGNMVTLAVTIARNRCRNVLSRGTARTAGDVEALADRLPDGGEPVLDVLARAQLHQRLRKAFAALDRRCRDLLRALFVEQVPTDEVRRRLGLGTVQAVYYRREACVEHLRKSFQRDLAFGSWQVEGKDGRRRRTRGDGGSR